MNTAQPTHKDGDPHELLALYLEGEASESDLILLRNALQSDDTFQREAVQWLAIHGQLGVAMEDDLRRERVTRNILKNIQDNDSEQFVMGVQNRLIQKQRIKRAFTGIAIAAVLALSLFAVFFFDHPSPSTQAPEVVATLQRVDGVQWIGSTQTKGSVLHTGKSLRIQSGLVELDLAGRGSLVVEGPAQLDFPSSGVAVLHQGHIVMRATEKGHGYQIKTPQGNIVDLGTEFGISVEPDGSVQTHVIDGHIEVTPKHGKATILTQNKALELNADGEKQIPADPGKFYTQLPPISPNTPKFIHWSLNEGKDGIARSSGNLTSDTSPYNPDMVFYAIDQGSAPRWVPGVQGSALHFDGKGGYSQSGYPGIEGGNPRTVCFWVKVPQDFSPHQGFAMLSWGNEQQLKSVWQISANPRRKDGPVGRLRIGLHGAQVIGTTDLRDSQWHHIAVVLYGGSQPNIGTHVILYIDGQMETISRRSLAEVKTNIKDAHHGVWLGRNITYTAPSSSHEDGGFFRGDIDEVYIFNAALDQDKILNLIEDSSSKEAN